MENREGFEDLDEIDIRILSTITERRYISRNEIHSWVEDVLPSIAIFQHRLDVLEEEGLIEFEPWLGYIRTWMGTLRLKRLMSRDGGAISFSGSLPMA